MDRPYYSSFKDAIDTKIFASLPEIIPFALDFFFILFQPIYLLFQILSLPNARNKLFIDKFTLINLCKTE